MNDYSERMRISEQVARATELHTPRAGEHIARRFADIGYEEFLVLPQERMVSLLSGVVSPLPQGDEDSVFVMPSIERLVGWCGEHGIGIAQVAWCHEREWHVHLVHGTVCCEGRSVDLQWSFVQAVAEYLGVAGQPKKGRGLRLVRSGPE